MKNNNKNYIPIILSALIQFSALAAHAELRLPSGADRRPNLSIDPFERAREAKRNIPTAEPKLDPEPIPASIPEPEPTPKNDPTPIADVETKNAFAPKEKTQNPELPPTIVSTGETQTTKAFSYKISATVDALSITAGGIEPKETDFEQSKTGVFGLVKMITGFDTGAAKIWNNGLFFLHAAMIFGKAPAVGDLHGTSNIYGGGNTFRFMEAWYQHSFPNSRASALIGLHNFNSEFYVSQFANLFMNLGFSMGQVIRENANPSTYPTPTLGIRFNTQLSKIAYFRVAIYDAKASDNAFDKIIDLKTPSNDEVFLGSEFGLIRGKPGISGYFKAGVGLWYLNVPPNNLTDSNSVNILVEETAKARGNAGVYVLAEISIGDKLGIFFKHGRGRKAYNRYSQFYATGLNYIGIIPGRVKDVLGIGLVHTRQSSAFVSAFNGTASTEDTLFVAETAIEITYSTKLTEWLNIQPDFQFIQQPSMVTQYPNAIVIGLRASAVF